MTKSNSTPNVSIIMPTYNRAEYILEAIESIRNQTYRNWELVIVDDGSDDNTEALISSLHD
jgi:glycosyltransferase involved in cell wall biosynthesis